jgi:sodium/potassium-transporting ATPase subunit alpha
VGTVAPQSAIWRLLKEFTQFFSVILWVASGLAFVADWLDPGQGMARIGYAIVAVIIVSGVFSFWQEYRIEQTLAALRKLLPQSVKLLRDKRVVQRPADGVVVGDILLLEAGDVVHWRRPTVRRGAHRPEQRRVEVVRGRQRCKTRSAQCTLCQA